MTLLTHRMISRCALCVCSFFAFPLLVLLLISFGGSVAQKTCSVLTPSMARAQETPRLTGELTVFAAASLTEPFTEVGKRLEALYPGLKVVYNFGGSPALRMQLEQGAHADVFVLSLIHI